MHKWSILFVVNKCVNRFGFQFLLHTAVSSILSELMVRWGCLVAAMNLHKALLYGMLHAPLAFFDQTPSGRILARFAKDIDVLDITLPESIKWLIYCAAEVIMAFFYSIAIHISVCTDGNVRAHNGSFFCIIISSLM